MQHEGSPSKRGLRAGLIALTVTASLSVAVGVLAYSRAGLLLVAQIAERALSDDAITVQFTGLEGSIVSPLTIAKVAVADRRGTFLKIETIALVWHPLALLGGTFHAGTLNIGRIRLDRPPDVSRSAPAAGPYKAGFGIRLDALRISEVSLGKSVLGTEQRLSVEMSVRAPADGRHSSIRGRLAATDGGPARATVDIDYEEPASRLAVRVSVSEPSGGPVSGLIGLPAGTPLAMDLAGDGSLQGWSGRLSASAGALLTAQAGLRLADTKKGFDLVVDGTASFGQSAPAPLGRLGATPIAVQAGLFYRPSGELRISYLRASNDLLAMEAKGVIDTAAWSVSATVQATASVEGARALIDPALESGSAVMTAAAAGSLWSPRLDFRVAAEKIAYRGTRVAAMQTVGRLGPDDQGRVRFSGDLRLEGFYPSEAVPRGLFSSRPTAEFGGVLERDGALSDMVVRADLGPSRLVLSGAFHSTGVADGSYTIEIPHLGPVSESFGLALRGRAEVSGDFLVEAGARSVQSTITGTFDELSSEAVWASAVIGRQVPFVLGLDWRDGTGLDIVGLEIQPAIGRIQGEARLMSATGAIHGRFKIAQPDLARLSALSGQAVSGAATAVVTLDGSIDAVKARLEVSTSHLAVGNLKVGDLRATAAGRHDPGRTTAVVKLDGEIFGRALRGDLAMGLKGEVLTLSRINLGLGRNIVDGAGRIDLSRVRADGTLAAELPDLSDLAVVFPIGPSGSAKARVRFTADEGQEVFLDVTGQKIVLFPDADYRISIGEAVAELKLRDPLGTRSFAGTATLTEAGVGPRHIDRMTVGGNGTFSALDWKLAADGREGLPFSLSANGAFGASATGLRLSVARFAANFSHHEIRLTTPVTASLSGPSLNVEPFEMSVAGGGLRLQFALDDRTIRGKAELEKIPVVLGAVVDPRLDLDGTVSGSIRVHGPIQHPTLAVTLDAPAIRPRDVAPAEFAGFSVVIDAEQDPRQARLGLRIAAGEEFKASADLRTDALFEFGNGSLALDRTRSLSGQMEATGNLAMIDRIIGLGGDRISGKIALKAAVSGTVGKPDIVGEAKLSQGSYEGVATGVVIRETEFRLLFTGQNARLASLNASDGAGGRLSGSGEIAFDDAFRGSGGIVITLDRFAMLRRPEAQITASGQLTGTGSFAAPRLSGRIRVDKSELRIPDRLPDEVVDLDVVEINRADQPGSVSRNSRERPGSEVIALEVDVSVQFPGRTFVRGRGLDSEWSGDLHVRGAAAKPRITGSLKLVRGTFAFAGKTFTMRSGNIRFPEGGSPEPEIDATAETALKTFLARVRVSGKASSPRITISSEPALPQEEVLAQILFGRSTGQLSPIQAAQLARTAATLSGAGGGTDLIDRVRQTIGVDVLNVEAGNGTSGGASLKAGKYVNEKVFLSVTQGTEPGSQKVGVEVEVLPSVTVESDISGTAESNLGVKWKFNY